MTLLAPPRDAFVTFFTGLSACVLLVYVPYCRHLHGETSACQEEILGRVPEGRNAILRKHRARGCWLPSWLGIGGAYTLRAA